MKWQARIAIGLMGLMTLAASSGCGRYGANRYYDFRDVFDIGVGITGENPVTGIIPPSFGLHAQITDYMQLGWVTHNGVSAELDMRGTYVGFESYTRAGFLWWQYFRKYQDYELAHYMNAFKDKDFLWCTRMESYQLAWNGRVAKRLHYEHYAPYAHQGFGLLHQGYQYWGYTGVNLALSEPFLTHLGFNLRLAIDPSEIMDFLLGIFTVDALKHDDMLPLEYEQFRNGVPHNTPMPAPAPMMETPVPTPAPTPEPMATPAPVAAPQRVPAALETVYFDFDKSDIRADQVATMERNLAVMQANPEAAVQVVGHADARGSEQYNLALGMRRARSVHDWLVARGVASARMELLTRGENSPAIPQAQTEEQFQLNRRVELRGGVMTIEAMPAAAAPPAVAPAP